MSIDTLRFRMNYLPTGKRKMSLSQVFSNSKTESGQALLIVLLSMAVVLTIVLSIVSRTIVDIGVTTKEEEALRAFSAAEAGVERALIVGTNSGSFGDASFTATVSNYGFQQMEYQYPEKLLSGESATVWFVDHDETSGELTCSTGNCFTGDQMKVCWGEAGTASADSQTPAIEVNVFYAETPGDYSTIKVARDVADPNTTRRSSNRFSAPDGGTCEVEGKRYEFQKIVNFASLGIPSSVYNTQNGLLTARITLFYNTSISHPVGIDVSATGNTLPSQGLKIVSTGVAGEANRRIEVSQTFGELPPIFDAVIYTPGALVK